MKTAALGNAVIVLMVFGGLASSALGSLVTYITPTNATNGSSSVPTGTAYTSNLGYAFMTGSSGDFQIDWASLEMNGGGATPGSFQIAIHGTNNDTAYSAVANSTVYATDRVSFTFPGTSPTAFTLNLTSVELPNITGYRLEPNTAYSLIVYSPSSPVALRRTTGFADGTTNDEYTVTNGFTMLDTFRNNTPNYSNSAGSYPTFAISFGGEISAIPEPGQSVGLASLLASALLLRYRTRR
jgi:hypothetical protein